MELQVELQVQRSGDRDPVSRTHWGGRTSVLGWTLGRLLADAPI